MASSFTIPLTTLPVGTQNLGPSSIPDADTALLLTIDRTVTGGLNSLPATSTITMTVQQSDDSGATWQTLALAEFVGGSYINRHTGLPYTASTLSVALQPGTSRELRASVVVAGSSIAVAGSLASS